MENVMNSYPVVCFGETLWDILPHEKLPGGAPMNVAYHLKKLGNPAALISRIGKDQLGKELLEVCRSKEINTQRFQVDETLPTGNVFATIGENNEVHYDIVKPVAWDQIQWQEEYAPLIKNAAFFVFGSLITRSPESYNTLLQCLESANTKVLDINMRPPHYNQSIIETLLFKADILKMNIAELELVTGWYQNFSTSEDRILSLSKKFNINTIIVTRGGEGAILYMNESFYYHDGFKVTVADTVGSGDSFLAAMLSKLIERAPPNDLLQYASAMGALVASNPGGCPDYDVAQVINLINKSNQTITV